MGHPNEMSQTKPHEPEVLQVVFIGEMVADGEPPRHLTNTPQGSRSRVDARSGAIKLDIGFTTSETSSPTQAPTAATFTLAAMASEIGISIEIAQVFVQMHLNSTYLKVGDGIYQLKHSERISNFVQDLVSGYEGGIPLEIGDERRERHMRLCGKYALTTVSSNYESVKINHFIYAVLRRRYEAEQEILRLLEAKPLVDETMETKPPESSNKHNTKSESTKASKTEEENKSEIELEALEKQKDDVGVEDGEQQVLRKLTEVLKITDGNGTRLETMESQTASKEDSSNGPKPGVEDEEEVTDSP